MIRLRKTPLERLDFASSDGATLWAKRDDASCDLYGGNKPRKLAHILEDARAKGAKRLVTIGAAGSHHVLATTLFGRSEGFRVAAVLTPQIATPHVVEVLGASIAAGLEPIPVSSSLAVVPALLGALGRGDYFVPAGGSNVAGTRGYVSAAVELVGAIRNGEIPEPDAVVVPMGSGGTAVGLAAGIARARLRTKVVGVVVFGAPFVARLVGIQLAFGVTWPSVRWALATLRRLEVEPRYVGRGYGRPTEEGARAADIAARCGLVTDPTYTSKAFACALDLVRSGRAKNVVYWHTLSSTPMPTLPEGATLPTSVLSLLRGPSLTRHPELGADHHRDDADRAEREDDEHRA